jgi:hypothetical protein
MSDASIAVVFSADTGKFIANVEGMDAATVKTANAIAAAKNKILQSFNDQVQAATKTGASAQQLANIQTKAAQGIASVTEQNANRVINSLDRISARQKAVAAELGNLKVPEVKESSEITDRMRASALLRGGGLRAGENFASQFQAFNQIATIAFPVLGLATLTEEAIKFGKAIYEAFDMGGNRARQTASEVLSVSNALRDSSTSLDIQIDKLQQEQAKLEKKPFNGLKLALDEAAEASENLQKRLDGVLQAELKVLVGMSASMPQKLLTGGSDTHQEQVMLGEHNRYIQQAGSIQDQDSESKSYARALQTRLVELQRMKKTNENTELSAAESGSGGTAILTHYDEEIKAVQQLMKWQGQEQQNIQKTIDLQKQQADTQTARDKHEQQTSDHSASEAANKANEARLKSMEAYVNQWKTQAPVSASAIYSYWEVQKSTFSAKSNEFNAIVAKQAELAEAGARAAHEQMQKLRESLKAGTDGAPAGIDRNINFQGNNAESARSLQRTGLSTALGDAEAQAQVDKTKVNIDQASGAISKLTADQRLAAIEADLHAKRLADLNEQLEDLRKNSGTYNSVTGIFSSDKDQQRSIELQSQITKEQASASVDALKSAADIAGQTWFGALKNANAQWIQNSQDSAKQVAALYSQVMNGVNNDLTGLLTGQHSQGKTVFQTFKQNLGNTADGVGKTLVNTGLQKAEGAAMKAFGLGKRDGSSASSALYVTMAGGTFGSGVASGGKGIKSLFSKGGDDSDDDDDSSGVGGFVKKIGGFFSNIFGGAKAVGGDVTPGHIYRMNESGQELFAPSVSGKIIPAGSSSGGGSSPIVYSVNVANGVTPEQMDMHVRAALQAYHPHAVAASVAAVHDAQRRRPAR